MGRTLWRTGSIVLAALLVACGADDPPPPPASSATPTLPASAAGQLCPDDAVAGRQVRFGNGGKTDLGGAVYGTGTVGVVLAHQSSGSMCDLAFYGRELAGRGYRVLAFDFSGYGASEDANNGLAADLGAAAALLRSEGAAKVVLVGASMGATASIVAGTRIRPPVAGVVSLSAPVSWMDAEAKVAAPRLRVPVLYIAGDRDGSHAEDARALNAATRAGLGKAVVIQSPSHGVGLLTGTGIGGEEIAKRVRAEIDAFLSAVAPPA